MRFENQGVETDKFTSTNEVWVSIDINALNENEKTSALSTDIFTVYGLDSSGNTVATATLKSVIVGHNEVLLTGNGIVSVKVVMTGYPHNGNKYCNVVIGQILLSFDGSALDNSGNQGGNDDNNNPGDNTGYTYTDFTNNEKSLFETYIGAVIPFIPNDEYYVEGYYDETGYEYGMSFYTFGNTQNDFKAYQTKILNAGYSLYETYEDEYGDTWYTYTQNDIVIDVSFYYYEGDDVVDLYVYSSLSKDLEEGGNGGSSSDIELITTDGKGLPSGVDGVYNANFNDATNVKNVTQQGYYLDGCPTSGDVKVLVIPVEFSDRTASSLGYDLNKLDKAFNGTGNDTDYYSVKDYFYISSYQQLSLDFVVCSNWFKPQNKSTYYATQEDSEGSLIGDQMVMDEALAYLSTIMDLSQFDSDNNGTIDAVVLVTTLEIDQDKDFYWAYRYRNYYVDEEGNYYEYDEVSANDYLWAPYQFLFESYDSNEYLYIYS